MPQQKKPAAGAPAQGAGGQKAAGQAAPPSKPKQVQPKQKPLQAQPQKQPQKLPPAGAPAQGAAGKGQAAAPGAPKAKPLTPQQTKQLAAAQAGGREAQYLKNHPGVAKHQQKIGAGAPATGASGGKANQPPGPTPPPPGSPPAGAGANKGGAQPPPGTNANAPAAPAATPAAPPTVEDIMNKQYGANAAQTFQQDWYGDNPLTTAMGAANRVLGENLANVRARYAGSGFGNSAREALAEGQAVGDVATNLGANLAQLGTQVRGSDLDRMAQMFATAGQQDIQQKQIGAELNQQLANLGTGLTGVGASEQEIPGSDLLTTLLTNMSQQQTYSQGRQRLPRK